MRGFIISRETYFLAGGRESFLVVHIVWLGFAIRNVLRRSHVARQARSGVAARRSAFF